jgi:hypothetical protein
MTGKMESSYFGAKNALLRTLRFVERFMPTGNQARKPRRSETEDQSPTSDEPTDEPTVADATDVAPADKAPRKRIAKKAPAKKAPAKKAAPSDNTTDERPALKVVS